MKSKSGSEGYPMIGYFTDRAIPLSGIRKLDSNADAAASKTESSPKSGNGKNTRKGRKKK